MTLDSILLLVTCGLPGSNKIIGRTEVRELGVLSVYVLILRAYLLPQPFDLGGLFFWRT